MHILYFSWGENSMDDFLDTLSLLGHTARVIQATVHNYLYDPPLSETLENELSHSSFDLVFSFDYLPFISEAAEKFHIKYVSWVYDCPHWTLYSPTLKNGCNYIFLFDRNMLSTVTGRGAKHAYHLPLACNTARTGKLLNLGDNTRPEQYENDIAFVGSLYENNLYDQVNYLPKRLRGYLDGIILAQKQLWGYNLTDELLTPDKITELQEYIKLDLDPACPVPPHDLFQNLILTKITSDERIGYLNSLSQLYKVALYSGSDAGLCPAAEQKGTISYTEQMPAVFHRSKINLNITLRSITSGIPLRALDIMGCGGFLLTNYQPELVEFFEPGRDFVYFESFHDLAQKAGYYLSHDGERQQIAEAGYKKVRELFSYEVQLPKILDHL